MLEQLKQFVEPLKRRILLMVGRAVLTAVKDDGGIQLIDAELMQGEFRTDIERFQDYGFTGVPPVDSEGVIVFLGGDRAHGLVLRMDSRANRLKGLKSGETAHYSQFGGYAKFTEDHEYHVRSNKWKMQGENYELMQTLIDIATQLKELADKLSTDTTNTMLGPMQLNGFATYASIKAQVDTLIGQLEEITV